MVVHRGGACFSGRPCPHRASVPAVCAFLSPLSVCCLGLGLGLLLWVFWVFSLMALLPPCLVLSYSHAFCLSTFSSTCLLLPYSFPRCLLPFPSYPRGAMHSLLQSAAVHRAALSGCDCMCCSGVQAACCLAVELPSSSPAPVSSGLCRWTAPGLGSWVLEVTSCPLPYCVPVLAL